MQKRDDALSREIGLKIFAGKYDDAIALMTGRTFSVWEGGSLDVAEHGSTPTFCAADNIWPRSN